MSYLTLAIIGILGAMSPGANFVITVQHSLRYGLKAGILTSLGIALGCLVHICYCVIAVKWVLRESILLNEVIKYISAAYLLYHGCKTLFYTHNLFQPSRFHLYSSLKFSSFKVFKIGFLVNILNLNALLFFLSLFTQFIDPNTSNLEQVLFGLELSLIDIVWYGSLACIINWNIFNRQLLSIQFYIEKLLGVSLILFGIRVIL